LADHCLSPGRRIDGVVLVTSTFSQSRSSLRRAATVVAGFVTVLWVIHAAESLFGLDLYRYGVLPRHLGGLEGILAAPLIHGSWSHVFANTLPLLILGTVLLYGYPRSAKIVVAAIWLVSGLGVWIFARSSYHIGASGLTHGLMFFIFIIGILRRDRQAIALALLVFFLYGGMVWTVLPQEPGVSFESHLFGAMAGAALAFVLRYRDPMPPEKKYAWEDEAGGE
jgi:membrane associated rhomboid family serine protease